MVDPRVSQAVRGGGVLTLDDRGLMPLDQARAVVRGVTAFVKGEGAGVAGVGHVLASDQIWAALLSLGDGAELVAAASRLDWQFHPRGFDNVDLHRRYGDAIVPWLATRLDAAGVLHNMPWCVVPCLLACDGDAAFELVWRVRAVDGRSDDLATRWLQRHPETGARMLHARAASGDVRAQAHLAAETARAGQPPVADHVLGLLDACAARLMGSPGGLWPSVDGVGPNLCHGLRAIAVRAGADWGLAIERLEGDRAGGVLPARIAVFAYGSRVRGHLAGVAVRQRPAHLAGAPSPAEFVAWLQGRLAADADAVWGPASLALPALGMPADATIVAVVPYLAHVADAPSTSPVYQALAAALVSEPVPVPVPVPVPDLI